jgi:hypothetical protein
MSYTITRDRIPEYPGRGRLGRHVHHDSRSLAYPYQPPAGTTIATQLWTRSIPILDQGNVGSCTTNAGVGCLGTAPLYGALPAGVAPLNETLAVNMYSEEEKDLYGTGYPPEDQGGDGLTTCKIMQRRGFISGYTHCFDLNAMLAALQAGPVMIGINWYDSFDSPVGSNALLVISPGAQVRGGHELAVRKIDPVAGLIGGDNSWGKLWGDNGSWQMALDTMNRLLAEQGDVTVPLPLSVPAPVPVPPAPVPVVHQDPADLALAKTGGPWARTFHPGSGAMRNAYRAWAKAKGL